MTVAGRALPRWPDGIRVLERDPRPWRRRRGDPGVGRVREPVGWAELDAATELACQVIADDTARIAAHAERQKALVDEYEARVRMLEQEAAELGWQVVMVLGFTVGEIPQAESPEDR